MLGCPIRTSADRRVVCTLPAAYRSLPRPSSSPRAKASAIRPYLLPKLANKDLKNPYYIRIITSVTLLDNDRVKLNFTDYY